MERKNQHWTQSWAGRLVWPYLPKRHVLVFLVFLGFVVMTCLRSCISVALVAMTMDQRESYRAQKNLFEWSSGTKGLLLSSFFYGYIALQVPGGWLSLQFGFKKIFGAAIFLGSLLSLAIPSVANSNIFLLMVVRVLQGVGMGVCVPTNLTIWSVWAPRSERSLLISLSTAGLSAGMVVCFPLSGYLAEYGFNGGWPSIFYSFGFLGLLWSILWWALVYESPEQHPFISNGEALLFQLDKGNTSLEKVTVPWTEMLRSRAVMAIVFAQFMFDCSHYTLLICTPLYLKDVYHLRVSTTGLLSALPWVFMSLLTFLSGLFSDWLRQRGLSTTSTRKLCYGTGMVMSSVCIVSAGTSTNVTVVIALVCSSVGFFGLSFSGFMCAALDIAPKFAGVTIGLSNCISTVPGFLVPTLVGYVTKDGLREQWLVVFCVMAGASLLGVLVFTFLGTAEEQEWSCGALKS